MFTCAKKEPFGPNRRRYGGRTVILFKFKISLKCTCTHVFVHWLRLIRWCHFRHIILCDFFFLVRPTLSLHLRLPVLFLQWCISRSRTEFYSVYFRLRAHGRRAPQHGRQGNYLYCRHISILQVWTYHSTTAFSFFSCFPFRATPHSFHTCFEHLRFLSRASLAEL